MGKEGMRPRLGLAQDRDSERKSLFVLDIFAKQIKMKAMRNYHT
jgi:hypothetical protein